MLNSDEYSSSVRHESWNNDSDYNWVLETNHDNFCIQTEKNGESATQVDQNGKPNIHSVGLVNPS